MRTHESLPKPLQKTPPPSQPPEAGLAIRAWNLLGGRLDWQGIAPVAELLGIEDIDMLIFQLAALRDFQRRED